MAASEKARTQPRWRTQQETAARRVGALVGAAALTGVVLTGTSLVLAGPAAVAGATSPHETIHVSTAKVPNVGTVLTTGSGLTLYRFSADPLGSATCTGACAKVWPPLLASKGTHVAGPRGEKGLSLIKVGNRYQVSFHNVALYRFTGDKKKGQAKGQGVENAWFAVLKSGIPASTSAPAAVTPTTATPGAPAPTTTTTPPPASETPMTQVPAPATPATSPPTTPTTSPPTTTTTQPPSAGGGGVSF